MKDKLLMILFVLVLGSILTSGLIVVSQFTEPLIVRNAEVRIKSSVLDALGISFTESLLDEVFEQNIEVREREEKIIYLAQNGQRAFEFSGAGLWGPITGILSLDPDLKTIGGITIVHQEETPGLGSRIAELPYLESFKSKTFSPRLRLIQAGKGQAGENTIDSISGATMSSVAFINILNDQFNEFLPALAGE